MNSKLIRTTLLVISFLLSLGGYAQTKTYPGLIITAQSDTLHGTLLQEKNQTESIKFRKKGGNTFDLFLAKDITRYIVNDSLIFDAKEVTVKDTDKTVFLRVIVDGPVKLYSGKGLEEGVDFYIQKPDAPLLQLYRAYYKGTLASNYKDCSSLQVSDTQVTKNLPPYSASGLASFVEKYTACIYPEQPSATYLNDTKLAVTYGVRAGAQSSGLRLDSDMSSLDANQDRNYSLTAGLFLNLSIDGSRFSLQPEINYNTGTYISSYEYKHPLAIDYTKTFSYDLTFFQVPVLLKYTFNDARLRPFLSAGPAISFILSSDVKMTTDYETDQSDVMYFSGPNRAVGYFAGAGIAYPITKRKSFILELRYNKETTNNNTDDMKAVIDRYQLSAAITL